MSDPEQLARAAEPRFGVRLWVLEVTPNPDGGVTLVLGTEKEKPRGTTGLTLRCASVAQLGLKPGDEIWLDGRLVTPAQDNVPSPQTVDRERCMGQGDGLHGLCQKPATYASVMGRRCETCAEQLRRAMRSPNTLANLALGRARTEDEIAKLLVRLPERVKESAG